LPLHRIPGPDLSLETGYADWGFCRFLQSYSGVVHQIRPNPFHILSRSLFTNICSFVVFGCFDDTISELLTTPLQLYTSVCSK
jgi:hypothetical protein